MSYAVETAPPARDRSIARCASRQAKASREKRIIDCLNRGVSVVEIAERENVSEKRMRALVRDVLARRMPEPPAQFLAMQVNRLNEALRLSFGAMSGANLQAVDRVVRIVRELDRYHGFVAAERWGLPVASETFNTEADKQIIAQLVKRIRETPARLETIESAPGNGMAPETPLPLDPAPRRDGAPASGFEPAGAPSASPRIASQGLEKIDSRLGNCMVSETKDPQDVVGGRDGAFASALAPAVPPLIVEPPPATAAANPSGPRRVNMRMTATGVMACP
jgi:DNA-binding CsgD family transcriptional regulator